MVRSRLDDQTSHNLEKDCELHRRPEGEKKTRADAEKSQHMFCKIDAFKSENETKLAEELLNVLKNSPEPAIILNL